MWKEQSPTTEDQAPDQNVSLPPLRDYNTGPKGVIEDYKDAKRLMIARLEQERKEKIRIVEKQIAFQVKTVKEDEEEKLRQEQQQLKLEAEDEDEQFLKKYRQMRLEQLKKQQEKSTSTSTAAKFGKLVSLTADQFVDFIEKENHDIVILVHLYEKHNRTCQRLDDCLEDLAEKYVRAKFGKLSSKDALSSFDEAALPAVLVYKANKLMDAHLRLSEDLGHNFDVDDVETFLIRHHVLHPSYAIPL